MRMKQNRNDVRRIFITVFFMMAVVCMVSFTAVEAEALSKDVPMVPASFSKLADSVSPAVVNIRTEKTTKIGGGFRHFSRPPFRRKNDPFEDFFVYVS